MQTKAFTGAAIPHLGQQCCLVCSSSKLQQQTSRRAAVLRLASAAADNLPAHCLDNGFEIRHTSTPAEVEFLYREHYQQRVYLQHQVMLGPGAVVVDVGANIGLFTMFAAEAAGPTGYIVSLEPAPRAAAALTVNIQQHADWCAGRGKQVARCQVVQAAVGDGSQQEAQLTIYQGASGWSTLQRDDAELLDNMQLYLQNLMQGASTAAGTATAAETRSSSSSRSSNAGAAGMQQQQDDATEPSSDTRNALGWSRTQQLLVACAGWLSKAPLLRPLSKLMSRLYVEKVMMGQAECVTCQVVTVSQIIEQYDISRVDLLKVDVERAELAVLQGIQPHHWPAIQQVAMEVHDTQGQLHAVLHLLRQAGFSNIVWEQDPQLKGSTLYNLYATRGSGAAMCEGVSQLTGVGTVLQTSLAATSI